MSEDEWNPDQEGRSYNPESAGFPSVELASKSRRLAKAAESADESAHSKRWRELRAVADIFERDSVCSNATKTDKNVGDLYFVRSLYIPLPVD